LNGYKIGFISELTADRIGGIAKDVITEIDSWSNVFLSTGNVITILGI
jgi:hypothetical protein